MTFTLEQLEHMRRVAEAADDGGRPWFWKGRYPQSVVREGDVVLIADTFTDPDFPADKAEFISTFDPPTVLAILAEVVPHG